MDTSVDTGAIDGQVDEAENVQNQTNETGSDFIQANEAGEETKRTEPRNDPANSTSEPKRDGNSEHTKENRPDNQANGTRKLKVNGKEVEVSEKELIETYQKERAAEQRFQEASQIRKQLDSALQAMSGGDTDQLVSLIGKDAAENLAEKILLDKINYESLSDEQRKILELENENNRFKSEKEKYEQERVERERVYAQNKAIEQIDTDFKKVFDDVGIKPTPRIVARMAEIQLAHLDSNGGLLDPKKAYELVQRDLHGEMGDYLKGLNYDKLTEVLPKDILEVIRKGQVAAAESHPLDKKPDSKPSNTARRKKREMSTNDWFDQMDKKFGV